MVVIALSSLDVSYFQETMVYFFQAIFENIDPESLTNQVMKYHKVVLQLEKGLPPNSVVPQLRGKVDKMRNKVLQQNSP